MTKPKYTPGPWRNQGRCDVRQRCIVHEVGGGQRAIAEIYREALPEHDANARLIAAAPDLLAALRRIHAAFVSARNQAIANDAECIITLQTSGGAQYAAEDAIARAEGGIA